MRLNTLPRDGTGRGPSQVSDLALRTLVLPLFTCIGGRIRIKGSGHECTLTLPLTGSVISAKPRILPRGRNYKMRVITPNLS